MKFSCITQRSALILLLLSCLHLIGLAQYKEFKISVKNDTINVIDRNDLKQGKWVISVPELRGEPGYEEEGIFKNGKKEGVWRRYNVNSDIIAVESYRFGGKDGTQQYFTKLGDLTREENWRAYNPDAPYDTIAVYGTGSNEIISYKIVKAEQYSVRNGEWKIYDPSTGRLIKTDVYDRGHLQVQPGDAEVVVAETKAKVKPPREVLDYEKKNSGKKKVKLREGQTGL